MTDPVSNIAAVNAYFQGLPEPDSPTEAVEQVYGALPVATENDGAVDQAERASIYGHGHAKLRAAGYSQSERRDALAPFYPVGVNTSLALATQARATRGSVASAQELQAQKAEALREVLAAWDRISENLDALGPMIRDISPVDVPSFQAPNVGNRMPGSPRVVRIHQVRLALSRGRLAVEMRNRVRDSDRVYVRIGDKHTLEQMFEFNALDEFGWLRDQLRMIVSAMPSANGNER